MRGLRRTPLYEVAVAEGGRMAPFGGWEMAVQFEGIRSEHWAVRREVGLFDISHMGRIAVSGERGLAFLDSLLPARVRELIIGQMLYAPLCNERGGCVDDLVVYRLAEQEYLLVVNASRKAADWQWITARAADWSNVLIEDLSDDKGMVAVQGPQAATLVESLAGPASVALGYYRCSVMEIAGIRALLSRNGYTGEDGFEIVCPADQVAALWAKLRAAGAQPCGLGARDTLRVEMGFCLYGRELNEQTTPLEAGLAWTLDLEKEANFVGAEALRAQRATGGYRRLRGFRMLERGIPPAGLSGFRPARGTGGYRDQWDALAGARRGDRAGLLTEQCAKNRHPGIHRHEGQAATRRGGQAALCAFVHQKGLRRLNRCL